MELIDSILSRNDCGLQLGLSVLRKPTKIVVKF